MSYIILEDSIVPTVFQAKISLKTKYFLFRQGLTELVRWISGRICLGKNGGYVSNKPKSLRKCIKNLKKTPQNPLQNFSKSV